MSKILFRNLFRFSQKEVKFAFDNILSKKYCHGLKIIKAKKNSLLENNYGKMLIITPRSAGKATQRNRIRRRLKNIYYQEKCYLSQFDWIIIVNNKAINLSFDNLKKILNTVISNNNI